MSKLPLNYDNKDQLPLYGLVYDSQERKYEYTLGGVAVLMASRPLWEEAVEVHEAKPAAMYVWVGVQPTASQAAVETVAS